MSSNKNSFQDSRLHLVSGISIPIATAMFTSDQVQQLRELSTSAQSTLVLLPPNPTHDQVASGLALYQALQALGKSTVILSPQALSPDLLQIIGADQIQHQLGNRDLSISFAYQPEAVDKVSYHIDEQQQRFYLVIKPQRGQRPLGQESVQFSYTGADADLIFLIGVHELESLEQLYFGYEQLFQTAVTVTFHSFEPTIGTLKLDASGTSSLSESMAILLQQLGWPVIPAAGTLLLQSIEQATENFQSLTTSAETFDLVAWLLRSGARRSRRNTVPTPIVTEQPVLRAQQNDPPHSSIPKKDRKRRPKPTQNQVGDLKHQPTDFTPRGG